MPTLTADRFSDLSYDCNGTGAQNWVINSGTTALQIAGTNYCLDAGSSEFIAPQHVRIVLTPTLLAPGSGTQMKIWQCYSALAAQTWYYTDDQRIALQGQGRVFSHVELASRQS